MRDQRQAGARQESAASPHLPVIDHTGWQSTQKPYPGPDALAGGAGLRTCSEDCSRLVTAATCYKLTMIERIRLERLRQLELRTVCRPEVFNTIAVHAAKALDCPTALVTIVEEETQWFLGRAGFVLEETPRKISFCSVCIRSGAPLLVGDAAQDSRFSRNPLVTQQPHIRSYLGIPLWAGDGGAIGALCVISPDPHAFVSGHVKIVEEFAALAEEAISAHTMAIQLDKARADLKEFNQLFQQTAMFAKIGRWRLAIATNELTWSDQVSEIHGLPHGSQTDLGTAVSFFNPHDRPKIRRALAEAIRNGQTFDLKASISRADGAVRHVRMAGESIDHGGPRDSIAGILFDCTETVEREFALLHEARRDQLTGLLNRSGFNAFLHETFAQNRGAVLTVMLIDLDGFKDINETLGQNAGDRVLTEIGRRLQAHVEADCIVARWGDNEFAVMLAPDTLATEAVMTGNALLDAIGQDINLDGHVLAISATCGLAQLRGEHLPEDLARHADLALSFGKDHGRGGVHCWNEDLEGISFDRQRAIIRLRHALAAKNAFAAYQPIVDLETGTVVAVEALLRIEEEPGKIITATDVFAAITDPLASRQVSRFMLEQILQDGPQLLLRFGERCQIGLNVSEADLRHGHRGDDFVTLMTQMTQSSALQPYNITLEVTETMLLRDEGGAISDGLRALDRLGFGIALDDFGTGYSSLTHLRDFPIGKVKIDKEFISAISHSHQSRMIIQAIVQMSRSLGLDVIAEGVEHANEEMFLRAIGCRYAQGYRYGKPARVSQLALEQHDASMPDNLPRLAANRTTRNA